MVILLDTWPMAGDSEHSQSFVAYRNYVGGLNRLVEISYGAGSLQLPELVAASRELRAVGAVDRRNRDEVLSEIEVSLQRAWGMLRAQRVADLDTFIPEFNATIPTQAYYAVYHALRAAKLALDGSGFAEHRPALNWAAQIVKRGLLPWPWSAWCGGCTTVEDPTFGGFPDAPLLMHPLASVRDSELPDRYGALLRTTRSKELQKRYEKKRAELSKLGRKNLSREMKIDVSRKLEVTTMFDVFWRVRTKANYDSSDVFVLGAASSIDAREFGMSLVALADATVAVLEVVVCAAMGPPTYLKWLDAYRRRCGDPVFLAARSVALAASV